MSTRRFSSIAGTARSSSTDECFTLQDLKISTRRVSFIGFIHGNTNTDKCFAEYLKMQASYTQRFNGMSFVDQISGKSF